MRTKLIITLLVFIILPFSVSAVKVNEEATACHDDGSFIIALKANNNRDVYTNSVILTADNKTLKGSWDSDKLTLTAPLYKEAAFTSGENQLVENKSYVIKINFKEETEAGEEDAEQSFNLECPGLTFTCKKLGIQIKDCTTSKTGKFIANLDINGLEQSQQGKMEPFKVIDYILDTQVLYKDITGYTSKRGSLPAGAAVTKTGDNQYRIEANFDKYTTNHVTNMIVRFNDKLIRPCSPSVYPEIILSSKKECTYKETEEDEQVWKKGQDNLVMGSVPIQAPEKMPIDQLRESVYKEISALETQKAQIETRLNELYDKRNELGSLEPAKEKPKDTGYSVQKPASEDLSKKQGQLNVLLLSLLVIIVVGGSLLFYLYREGYFY